MKIIVLASRKGGAGKTTLAAHLAVAAGIEGAGPVAVVDLDPMAGLSNWWNERKAQRPYFAQVGEGGLDQTLIDLATQKIKMVIIDTPPSATDAIGEILARSDIVLIPVVPSPNDLMAIGQTLDLVFKVNRPLIFVVNNAGTGKLTGQAATALSQHGTVAPTVLRTRQDFRSSMIDGRTVCETVPHGKSAAEVAELWAYIWKRINLEARRGKSAAA